ncbi:MAG: phosphoribosylanthranilate isomerase [Pseudobdellovibrionaceae bacterium]
MASVKICGIRTPEALNTARKCGAAYAGFVFYPPSPRALNLEQARDVIGQAGAGIKHVALLVDPDDRILDGVARLSLDMIQLHGNESPARVMEIRSHTDLPVMKSIPIARPEDTAAIAMYEQVADWILCDAKAQGGADLPGGNGRTFDWLVLKNYKFTRPWMLSGGLHTGNVREALEILTPDAVDVSSGVESSPGVKDLTKIRDFITAVKS